MKKLSTVFLSVFAIVIIAVAGVWAAGEIERISVEGWLATVSTDTNFVGGNQLAIAIEDYTGTVTATTITGSGDMAIDTDVLAVDTTNDVVSTSGWLTQPYAATTAQSYSLASAGKAAYVVQTAGEAATFHLMTDLLTTPGAGGLITIKTGDASDIVIDTQGAETIDGAATYTIDATKEAVQILVDGTGYQVVGAYLE